MDNVVEVSEEGQAKDRSQCKLWFQRVCGFYTFSCYSDYEQLKGEYKIVKALRDLSGFGWDEG